MKTALKVCLVSASLWSSLPTFADAPLRFDSFLITDFITAGDGTLDSAGDLIYDLDPCDPDQPTVLEQVFKPDGQALTFGEWSKGSGTLTLRCHPKLGTSLQIKASGLIPKGVYSVWLLTFDKDGNQIGEGSLGLPDGSQNHFIASASGQGELSVFQPAGPLSEFGAVTNCLLDEDQFLIAPVYHVDGHTHGGEPGPFCTFIEQIGFMVTKGE
jgi:hypothetical protein